MQMSAVDMMADRTATSIRPLRPGGNVSSTKVARTLEPAAAWSGYSTAAASPSHTAATASGMISTAASTAPFLAARPSRAAKQREKLSMPTKNASTAEATAVKKPPSPAYQRLTTS